MKAHTTSLPRLSIVVPSYNQGRFLGEALDSIFCQEYPDLEVVVMDGGSTDESVAIINTFAPRLKYWQSQPDGGQSAAINAGMRHCTGDLVAWLNSDDFYWDDALWTVGRAWAAHPGRGLYIGNGYRFEQASGKFTPFCSRHVALDREMLLWGPDYLLQPSTFVLREAWEEVQGLKDKLRYCMDWDIFLRVADRYRAVLINDYLGVSREYEGTKTQSGHFDRAVEILRMVREHVPPEATPGSLLFMLETILAVVSSWEPKEWQQHLRSSYHALAADVSIRWGNGNGFPARCDPQDSVFLPWANADEPSAPSQIEAASAPSITVIVPWKESDSYLHETFQSIAAQCYSCVDSLSAMWDAPNHSAAAEAARAEAINAGLKAAKGDIVGWLHPGDQLSAGALRAVARAFADDPDLDLVYGNAVHIDAEGNFEVAFIDPCGSGVWVGELPTGTLPPRHGAYRVSQSTVFFRRTMLKRHDLLDSSLTGSFFEYEFLSRLTRQAKTKRLERIQALCRVRSLDLAAWWSECYRWLRRRWPRALSAGFLKTRRRYVADFLGRALPGTRRGPAYWFRVAAAAFSALTGLGNPERWWRPYQPWNVPTQPWNLKDLGTEATEPLKASVQKILGNRMGRFHSLVCGPTLPFSPGSSKNERREFWILRRLAELSVVQYFAVQPSGANLPEDREPAPVDILRTPADLQKLGPDRFRLTNRHSNWLSRLGVALRRFDIPVPGPRNPHPVTSQYREVRGACRQAIQEVLEKFDPEFLFVTDQTNPLVLTLNTSGRKTRLILVVHELDSWKFRERALSSRWLRCLARDWETKRARNFEREHFAKFHGIIAANEAIRDHLVGQHGFSETQVLVLTDEAMERENDGSLQLAEDFEDWLLALTQAPMHHEEIGREIILPAELTAAA